MKTFHFDVAENELVNVSNPRPGGGVLRMHGPQQPRDCACGKGGDLEAASVGVISDGCREWLCARASKAGALVRGKPEAGVGVCGVL